MDLLSAKELQEMLGVEDLEVVAHGYNFDRHTVDIWFEDGTIVVETYKTIGHDHHVIEKFTSSEVHGFFSP